MTTVIPELEAALEAMVAARASGAAAPAPAPAPRRPRSRRRLSRRGAVVVLAVLLLAATAALAATGTIPLGAPAHDPAGTRRVQPDEDFGTVVPGTARVLALRVADPDGGPPWGVRLTATTRGLACLTAGRVVGGRLGALGRDGAFHDDGAFHPFPLDLQSTQGACTQLDGAGHAFVTGSIGALPAAGIAQGACHPRGTVTGDPTVRFCPDAAERTLTVGALGPDARSITYTGDDGRARTVAVAPPYGAYLIVRRRDPGSGDASGMSQMMYGVPDPNPYNTPLTRVTFAGGRSCAVTSDGWAGGTCSATGYRPRAAPRVTTADVRSPVSARVEHRGRDRVMVVRWRARVAVVDATTGYEVTRRREGAEASGFAMSRRDLRAGQVAEQVWYAPAPGVYHGRVAYRWFGAGPDAARERLVGTYTLKVP